jgi:cation transport ATPase
MSKQQPPAHINPKREQRIRETQQKREARLRAQRRRRRARLAIVAILMLILIALVAFFLVAHFAFAYAAAAHGLVSIAGLLTGAGWPIDDTLCKLAGRSRAPHHLGG